jgi:hypothetical protein
MMRHTWTAALALLGIVAGLASAQAAPITNPKIIGGPVVTVTFADTPPGFVIFNEYLTEPSAVILTTGGGVGQADIFAPEGIAQPIPGPGLSGLGGIQGSFLLGLEGPGSVELALNGKVRTTVTTTVLQQDPPFRCPSLTWVLTRRSLRWASAPSGTSSIGICWSLFPRKAACPKPDEWRGGSNARTRSGSSARMPMISVPSTTSSCPLPDCRRSSRQP